MTHSAKKNLFNLGGTKMKKIFSIAFAAILVGLTISCQKENSLSEQVAIQYTFNINVDEQFGFNSDALTKGGASPSYKTVWTGGDRIFLFFKPSSESLLEDTYATLTYNGSTWEGIITGSSSLGEGGTMSAVYVYNLDSSITPEFTNSQWTIASGNVFYNCQTGISYTVSNNEISASLNLMAPADFVQFYVSGGVSEPLTCNIVRGWRDVSIGSDMTFSNVTCTGYMEGIVNSGDPNVMEYYGRFASGTSLKDVECKFSIVKNGKVYEHSATPGTTARSFSMITTSWAEASGKLPYLFSVAPGKQIRFSRGNLYWDGDSFEFESNQTYFPTSYDASHVSHFFWTKEAADAYNSTISSDILDAKDNLFTNYAGFTANGQTNTWRTLSINEWQYIIDNYPNKWTSVDDIDGLVIAPNGYTISESYNTTAWEKAESEGCIFLPAAGIRSGSKISSAVSGSSSSTSGSYWSSTVMSSVKASDMDFDSEGVSLDYGWRTLNGESIRLVSECN